MSALDWRSLKVPLMVMAGIIAAAAAGIYYTAQAVAKAKTDLTREQNVLHDARMRLQKSGDEKNVIVRYLGDYQYLQRLGFIGDEQRINWLDGLRTTNQQTQMYGVDYQIGIQQPYPYSSELNPGQMALYQSIMKIHLNLLHEGDLMRFLGGLAQQRAGVFSVNQCVMDRIDATGGVHNQPNLRADCDLAWITERPVDSSGGGKS